MPSSTPSIVLPALLLVAVAAVATSTNSTTRPNHLQLDEFDRLLSTEVIDEFGRRHHPVTGIDRYNAAIDYEWDRAVRIEAAHDNRRRRLSTKRREGYADELHVSNHEGGVSPFVICDTSRNKNGHACRSTIEAVFGDDAMMVRFIYVSIHFVCIYLQPGRIIYYNISITHFLTYDVPIRRFGCCAIISSIA